MQRRLSRGLTPGEMRMASLLFGDAIDCARVRVHGRRYLPLVQPKNCASSILLPARLCRGRPAHDPLVHARDGARV